MEPPTIAQLVLVFQQARRAPEPTPGTAFGKASGGAKGKGKRLAHDQTTGIGQGKGHGQRGGKGKGKGDVIAGTSVAQPRAPVPASNPWTKAHSMLGASRADLTKEPQAAQISKIGGSDGAGIGREQPSWREREARSRSIVAALDRYTNDPGKVFERHLSREYMNRLRACHALVKVMFNAWNTHAPKAPEHKRRAIQTAWQAEGRMRSEGIFPGVAEALVTALIDPLFGVETKESGLEHKHLTSVLQARKASAFREAGRAFNFTTTSVLEEFIRDFVVAVPDFRLHEHILQRLLLEIHDRTVDRPRLDSWSADLATLRILGRTCGVVRFFRAAFKVDDLPAFSICRDSAGDVLQLESAVVRGIEQQSSVLELTWVTECLLQIDAAWLTTNTVRRTLLTLFKVAPVLVALVKQTGSRVLFLSAHTVLACISKLSAEYGQHTPLCLQLEASLDGVRIPVYGARVVQASTKDVAGNLPTIDELEHLVDDTLLRTVCPQALPQPLPQQGQRKPRRLTTKLVTPTLVSADGAIRQQNSPFAEQSQSAMTAADDKGARHAQRAINAYPYDKFMQVVARGIGFNFLSQLIQIQIPRVATNSNFTFHCQRWIASQKRDAAASSPPRQFLGMAEPSVAEEIERLSTVLRTNLLASLDVTEDVLPLIKEASEKLAPTRRLLESATSTGQLTSSEKSVHLHFYAEEVSEIVQAWCQARLAHVCRGHVQALFVDAFAASEADGFDLALRPLTRSRSLSISSHYRLTIGDLTRKLCELEAALETCPSLRYQSVLDSIAELDAIELLKPPSQSPGFNADVRTCLSTCVQLLTLLAMQHTVSPSYHQAVRACVATMSQLAQACMDSPPYNMLIPQLFKSNLVDKVPLERKQDQWLCNVSHVYALLVTKNLVPFSALVLHITSLLEQVTEPQLLGCCFMLCSHLLCTTPKLCNTSATPKCATASTQAQDQELDQDSSTVSTAVALAAVVECCSGTARDPRFMEESSDDGDEEVSDHVGICVHWYHQRQTQQHVAYAACETVLWNIDVLEAQTDWTKDNRGVQHAKARCSKMLALDR
eukprot:m.261154 g.261154  ORF g.261154 m.261154 type:complete len:1060 (+) comp15575_c1_seq3:48-3227(+)